MGLLTGTRSSEHISPILTSLHWLPVHVMICFKVLLFVFKSLCGLPLTSLSYYCYIHQPPLSRLPTSSSLMCLNQSRNLSRPSLCGSWKFKVVGWSALCICTPLSRPLVTLKCFIDQNGMVWYDMVYGTWRMVRYNIWYGMTWHYSNLSVTYTGSLLS